MNLSGTGGSAGPVFLCRGNEPFWNFRVKVPSALPTPPLVRSLPKPSVEARYVSWLKNLVRKSWRSKSRSRAARKTSSFWD